ncbi:MAG TPA: phospholipase D-like domain-containing protein [Anaerolineae bacterium]
MINVIRRTGSIFALAILLIACRAEPSSVSTATATPNPLQPFLEPDANQHPVLSALASAKKSIFVEMYLLTDNDVIDWLKQARGRGVDVRVLLEAQLAGGGPGNQPAISELQKANVTVKTANPAYRLTHAKVIVVDERVAMIMTLDQTRLAFTTNREFGIIDSNPEDVAEIISVFKADWDRNSPVVSNPNLVWSPINARERLLAFIDQARQTLDIEAEMMQDDEIEAHLIAAVRRGVAVRLVMSPSQNGPDPNAPSQQKLKQGGIKMRFLRVPYIDANMMVADSRRGFIGSQNFSRTSLDLARDLGILITDPRIVEGLAATFLTDWDVGK